MSQILEITPANEIKEIMIEDTVVDDYSKFAYKLECNMHNIFANDYLVFWNNKPLKNKNEFVNPMIQIYGTVMSGKPLSNYEAYGSAYIIKQVNGRICDTSILDIESGNFIHDYLYLSSPYLYKIEHVSGNTFKAVKYFAVNNSSTNGCHIV